jgi:uncharacterized protein (TIGR03437 family)
MVAKPGNFRIIHWLTVCLLAAIFGLLLTTPAPTVSAQAGYEGDVTPRPTGKNGAVTKADYEQIARFAAALDRVNEGSEFQRADSAPRTTLGDGRVGIADLVQALRYYSGFDPLTAAGGPTAPPSPSVTGQPEVARPEMAREVKIGTPTYATNTVTVPFELVALGNENALAFTLAFDMNVLSNPEAVLGTDATTGLLITNASQVGSGRLGIGMALPPGQKFAAGVRQILRVTFTIAPTAFGQQTPIGFASSPVQLEIADDLGNLLDQRIFTGDQITLNYPVPVITALNPGSAFAGDVSFTLGVIGSNFVSGSVVRWNGTNLMTTFQSPTLLTAAVPGSLITTAGTASITVFNLAPGGGLSNAVTFFINNPVPGLTGLGFSTIAAGGGAGTLEVTGSGFVPGSIVYWNGRPCPTRYISRTRLIVDYAAADIACAGIIRVTVVSPEPGGGTSVAQTFTIAPTIASINPTMAFVGGNAFTLTVLGTGFCEGTQIRVNGTPRTSTIVSSTQITTQISAAELSSARTLQISVGTSDGVISTALLLTVSDCSPAQARVNLDAALDFGEAVTPARAPIPNRPSRAFTVQNLGCQPLTLSFPVRRTGADVTSGKITNPDDSGTFMLFNTTAGANQEIRSGTTVTIPGSRTWSFRLDFDPKIPAPAGGITNLAASQVIPDVINSTLMILQGATTLATSALTGRVENGSRFINPLAPRQDPLVVLFKSGADEFTVEASGFDANTNIAQFAYQFYDAAGLRLSNPLVYDINLQSLGLLKGQSFSIVRKFSAKDTGLAATTVQVFFYDSDGPQSFATSGLIGTGRGRIVNATTVSAASFAAEAVATGGIASAFGENFGSKTEGAKTLPLPTELGDVKVYVTDANMVERTASLFFVSPTQINYLIPEGTVPGDAKVVVVDRGTVVSTGNVRIAEMAPALFTANSDGKGAPAAYAVRVKADGTQSNEPLAQYDSLQKKYVPAPLSLGPPDEQVILVLFGTGIRFYSSMNQVGAKIAGVDAEVQYAGPQGQYVGLDQVNIKVPRSVLVGGEVDLLLTIDKKQANPIRIHVR